MGWKPGEHAELGGPLVGGGGGGVAVAADRAGASPFQFGCDVLVRCSGGDRQVPGPAIGLVRSGARDGERAMRGLPLVVCGAVIGGGPDQRVPELQCFPADRYQTLFLGGSAASRSASSAAAAAASRPGTGTSVMPGAGNAPG